MALGILTVFVLGRSLIARTVGAADDLHGDHEEAVMALDSTLKPLPESKRLAFLLRSVRDPSPGLRYASVDALGLFHTPDAADAIEAAYRDSASIVRQRAEETLHVVDHQRGLLLLLAALRDEDSWIRESAATQLSMRELPEHIQTVAATNGAAGAKGLAPRVPLKTRVADKRCVPMLMRALNDEDEVVVRTALAALWHVTGRGRIYRTADGPAGRSKVLAEWKAWWAANASHYQPPPAFVDVQPIRPTRTDPAPDFELRDVAGQSLSLASQRGRVTLINFWGTWCPPCRGEVADLERIHRKYGPAGLTVLGAAVSEDHGAAGLRTWCTQHGLTYRQALSTDAIQKAYGDIHEVPVSVLIDKQGRIRYRWEGERDYSTFRAGVERLLAE
jgi:peroxiredoxin